MTGRCPRRPRRVGVGASLLLTLLLFGDRPCAACVPRPAPGAGNLIEAGLHALHQGEYDHALDFFRRGAEQSPAAVEPRFYAAYARWWQAVFGEGSSAKSDPAFDAAVEEVLSVAQTRLEATPGDPSALAAIGGAHVLRAHVEASRGNYFHSAQDVRRGKNALEQALERAPHLDTALFPMGALNYFADRVPLAVKGLRALLFVPGGDATLGLRQIREVVDGKGPLRTDGLLLLGQICSDRDHRHFAASQSLLRAAAVDNPGSPLIAAAIGDLQIRLAEYDQAVATFSDALQAEGGDAAEASRHRRWLHLGRAEALLGAGRFSETQEELERVRAEVAVGTPAMSRAERRVAEDLDSHRAAATSSDPKSAGHLVLEGRALLKQGKPQDALARFQAAAANVERDAPSWILGWINLGSGLAEKGLGDAKSARPYLKHAGIERRFRAADRARLELDEPGVDEGICLAP
jgi:tetratricopeptide (TPR) repeat protein